MTENRTENTVNLGCAVRPGDFLPCGHVAQRQADNSLACGQAHVLVLDVHICDQRRSYRATFATDEAAADFIARKRSTCAMEIVNDEDGEGDAIAAAFPKALDVLFPTCEHGLSQSLCFGPGHYPPDSYFD